MTAEALSSLPFSAGGAVAAAAGRAALWGVSAYMRAPLRNTAVAALVTLTAMAGSNALYRQTQHHPAPLFSVSAGTQVARVEPAPVMPAARPGTPVKSVAPEAPAKLALPPSAPRTPTRDDVFEVQRKLQSFGLFNGKVDGFYGPRTAAAIKSFEQKLGRTPRGELTVEMVELIRGTPIFAEPAKAPERPAVSAPVPKAAPPAPTAETAPAPLALAEPPKATPAVEATASLAKASAKAEAPLPAPAPLLKAAPQTTASVSEPAPTLPPTPAATTVTKRTVQTIAVRAEPAPAVQAMPPELSVPAGGNAATDPKIVAAVQRGLTSLGFLHGEVDGVAGEATAKAIRNFEVYFNYNVTGRITSELVKLLVQNGGVV